MSPGPGSTPPDGGDETTAETNQESITERRVRSAEPLGKAALIASVGGQRGWADWTNPDHRLRRLLAEFIGMAGLTFVLSGGAAILARYGGHVLQPWQTVLVLSLVSALWLVVAVYFLGDISAHFNPATTLAFALRRDMDWMMAGVYWVVQFVAAAAGSGLARAFFGPAGNLAATMPKPGQSWQAAAFEAVITFGLVLMILSLANGPKLNGPFIPLAVGAYILAWGTMGGPFDGASMNPARSFGPDLAIGKLSTWWVYLIGPVAGAVIAVGVAYVLRGPARAQEASAAQGTPLNRST
jgi:glycerol uptake facilitator-like aquaporin